MILSSPFSLSVSYSLPTIPTIYWLCLSHLSIYASRLETGQRTFTVRQETGALWGILAGCGTFWKQDRNKAWNSELSTY